MRTVTINQLTKIYYTDTTGNLDFSTLKIVNDSGIVSNSGATITEIVGASGLYAISFTPSSTGHYVITFKGSLISELEVVSKSIYSFLQNIEDESIGSWIWNKQLNTLTMVRQDGSTLANFNVVESVTLASRERTT
jgi:hypothetical protein